MPVLDASVLVAYLAGCEYAEPARARLLRGHNALWAPHLVDARGRTRASPVGSGWSGATLQGTRSARGSGRSGPETRQPHRTTRAGVGTASDHHVLRRFLRCVGRAAEHAPPDARQSPPRSCWDPRHSSRGWWPVGQRCVRKAVRARSDADGKLDRITRDSPQHALLLAHLRLARVELLSETAQIPPDPPISHSQISRCPGQAVGGAALRARP